jgi:ABC-type Fe3+ transport system substrate-binding protein
MDRPALIAAFVAVSLLACKPQPEASAAAALAAAAVKLETDMPDAVVDTALRLIAANGGPSGARVEAQKTDATVLPAAPGQRPAAPAPAAAELRWESEPYGAIAAAAAGQLAPMPPSGQTVPPLWRDAGGTWVAIGGRAEVLLINTDELGDHGAPVRFTALTEPWLKGKVALAAPTNGPALAHFAALYQAWTADRMEIWLAGLKNNQAQVLDSGDDVRKAVVSGKAVVGIVTSDQAAMAAASAAHVLVVYPNQRSIGTFVWPTALSVPKSASPEAQKLAERLADKSTEQLLVARAPGYLPLRGDIPTPPGVRSAANLVVISVDPGAIVTEIALRKERLIAWTEEMKKLAAK